MNMNIRSHQTGTAAQRCGAITVLFALLLPVLLILAAVTINLAYLQLTKTELMVATDSAARAGGRAISAFQNVDDAIVAAQVTAALNNVAGAPLRLNGDDTVADIEFGDAEPENETTGRFIFDKTQTSEIRNGNEQASAIRINGRMTDSSLSGPISAIFPTFGMIDEFNLFYRADSMQVDRDIALIIDRSGSMGFHPGYNWPNGFSPWSWNSKVAGYYAGILGYSSNNGGYFYYRSGQNERTYQDFLYVDHLNLGEAPKTPWEELKVAVDVFLKVLEETDQDEQVSLASYASNATLDRTLVKNYDLIRSKLNQLTPNGATAIGLGMQKGIPSLLDTYSRPFAAKTLLVMTDGVHNSGIDPEVVAASVVSQYDVTIHTVTFGIGSDQEKMQAVATIGGGQHYHADNGEELQDIFEEIANNLPTIVIQ